MQFRNLFKSFFSFSKSERRGIAVLLLIISVLLIIKGVISFEFIGHIPEEISITEVSDHDEFRNPASKIPETSHARSFVKNKTEAKVSPSYFNPNTASRELLVSIGFSNFAADNLISYRKKGGVFHKPEDVELVYGLDELLFLELKPFIIIERGNINKDSTDHIKLEINSASEEELQDLKGIGVILAERIVKYRNLLGGFHTIDQLNEVFGINDSLVFTLSESIEVDTSSISKINLNMVSQKELVRHPYLNYYEAKAIVKYRELMGEFKSEQDLVDHYLLSGPEYQKIRPYLCSVN